MYKKALKYYLRAFYLYTIILYYIDNKEIIDLNDFGVFNMIRTVMSEKWKEIIELKDLDISADLGELGF